MSTDSGSPTAFRENTRAPLQAPATLQMDAFSEPVTGFTANVSQGGMFVATGDIPPVGSIVKFQVVLGDPPKSVSGTAEVVWMRTQAKEPQEPKGVGLQFRFIEDNGAPLISAAVHKAIEELGPEPEPAPPVKRKPRPPQHPRPPVAELPVRDEKEGKSKKKVASEPKKKSADDEKTILGMPAEKVKLIVLLALMALLLLTFVL